MRPVTIVNNDVVAVSSLAGFAIRETAGAAAVVRIRKDSVSGQLIFPLAFAANESLLLILNETIPVEGSGTYVEVVSGSIEGVVFEAG